MKEIKDKRECSMSDESDELVGAELGCQRTRAMTLSGILAFW